MIRLRISDPTRGVMDVTVEGDQAVIGRQEGDVLVDNPVVSVTHAKVLVGVVIADLKSLNGVWVDGRKLGEPAVLEGTKFWLGGDPGTSPSIEVMETSLAPQGAGESTALENDRLRRRVAELEAELQRHARPGQTRPAGPVPPPAPPPSAPPARAKAPPKPEKKSPDGIPSFEDFFQVYRQSLDEAPVSPSAPVEKPRAPAQQASPVARQAVLDMIDRLVRDDVGDRQPLIDGPLEQFFTLESFRLLRQVEKVITRLARDFVQLYDMKTMLPGMASNFRDLAATVLLQPDDRDSRQELVKYLENLCRWLGVSLAANRHAVLKFTKEFRESLSPAGLTAGRPVPVWMKLVGQGQAELWRRANRRLRSMTSSVAEDKIEQFVKEYADEHVSP